MKKSIISLIILAGGLTAGCSGYGSSNSSKTESFGDAKRGSLPSPSPVGDYGGNPTANNPQSNTRSQGANAAASGSQTR